MTIGNIIIGILNRPLTRGILKYIIALRYKGRGKQVKKIDYHPEFGAWEFCIDGVTYLGSGPGWVYDKDYLHTQLKQLSGNAYMPKEGDVVVDIGAGVGEETIVFSSLVGDHGKVYAIEAHPKTFKALNYLVSVNKLSNVIASDVALSDKTGTVTIEDTDNSLGNSILQVSSASSFEIPAETFDEFIDRNKIDTVDFLKMNVEGAEQLIVKGMTQSLKRVKRVAISCHDFRYRQGESEFFKTKQIIVDFLTLNHFKISTQNSNVSMVDDYVYGVNPNMNQ